MFNNSGYSLADIAAATGNNRGGNDGFGDNGWWIILLFLFTGFGWGGRGGFGGMGGSQGYSSNGFPCATQLDVREAVDQQTLISKLDRQTYGLSDSVYALNNTITNGFSGVDNAICTLGYQTQAGVNALANQLAQCCCDTRAAIKDGVTQGVMNTNAIQQQIAASFSDLEKINMQNRFDAQTYNCNTLQAIDRLGDRIMGRLTEDKISSLIAENQALKFAASQANQNTFFATNQAAQTAEILNKLNPCPVPAYVVPNPNCCYPSSAFINPCAC